MLRYLYADQMNQFPKLRNTMFRDRAYQFKNRLGWNVTVDAFGFEKDMYDELNPLYVIWEMPDGTHGGSMRFLPTTGRTMVNEHFTDILGGGTIVSPHIWECTRFCLGPAASSRIAAALMLGGSEVMQGFDVLHFVGVFDARMVRIYRRIGPQPDVLGTQGIGRSEISVGLWEFTPLAQSEIAKRAGVSLRQSKIWFNNDFGLANPLRPAMLG